MSLAHRGKGRPASVWTEEQKERIRARFLGTSLSTETCQKISVAQKGKPLSASNRLGIKAAWNTEEKRRFARARARKRWASSAQRERQGVVMAEVNRHLSLSSPTSLEKCLSNLLEEFPEVIVQKRFGRYVVDAYLPRPYHLALEADGEYWHQDSDADCARDTYLLREFGLPVVRLTERELVEAKLYGESNN